MPSIALDSEFDLPFLKEDMINGINSLKDSEIESEIEKSQKISKIKQNLKLRPT